jgi:hypothetical protein
MVCPLIELWKIPLLARAYINPQPYASQALNDSVPRSSGGSVGARATLGAVATATRLRDGRWWTREAW